jgi:DNA-binding Lrp family transcriptional regulator
MELAFVLVKSKIGHEMEVMADILKIGGIKEVTGTFGQYDILVKVKASERAGLEKIITKQIRSILNVISTTTLSTIPDKNKK